jgi:aryl-alcohol dehydrogenase-like predicted oxidoreductase
MRLKLLGRSGMRVSEMALGTMTFGTDWGWGSDKEESKRVFDAYVEAGGNFIDTANRYTFGTSERYVGEFIKGDRDRFCVATKFTITHPHMQGDPNAGGSHRKSLMFNLRRSMERLDVDHVDLLWVHMWDRLTPIEETLRALDDVVSRGLVHYIGWSDAPAWVVSRANAIAELRGWTRFNALQLKYSLVERTPERELLPMARELELAVTPWAILGAGVLTGKYTHEGMTDGTERLMVEEDRARVSCTERNLAIARAVDAVAEEAGCTPSQVAIAWMRSRPGNIVPILGARTLEQVRVNLGALDITLTGEQLERLDQASAIEPGFPTDFLESPFVRELMYGGRFDDIDDQRPH